METTGARPLKVGLYIPNGVGYMAGGVNRWTDVLAMAQAAERTGFDSVWLADHMIFRFDDEDETQGRWEAWSMLAALAASTTRIEIGPLVCCIGFRNPALLAKMAETVDEISGGRLTLGLGAGWHEPEFTSYGFPFDHRASRFEESFTIVHDLLRTGRADFSGAYVRAVDCELRPRGPRPQGPPIMIGTIGERMLRLTARFANSWNTTWCDAPSAIPPLRALVDAACREVGRDPATLGRSACVYVDLPGRVGRFPPGRMTPPLPRSPEEIADVLRGFAGEGLNHAMLWLDPNSVAGVEAFAPTLALLDRG